MLLNQDWQFPLEPQIPSHFEGIFSNTYCTDPQWSPIPFPMLTRCRKCDKCLRQKQLDWLKRSREEFKKWPRHWLLTLTYRNTSNHDYSEVQKYLKRVRKTVNPNRLSYITCTEFNSSGKRDYHPHHHFIIHCGNEVKYRHLTQKWDFGFTDAELLKRTDAWYIIKYLTKYDTKIRASVNYGVHTPQPLLKALRRMDRCMQQP